MEKIVGEISGHSKREPAAVPKIAEFREGDPITRDPITVSEIQKIWKVHRRFMQD